MATQQAKSSTKVWVAAGIGVIVLGASVWGLTSWGKKSEAATLLPSELSVDALKAQQGEPGRMMDTMRNAMRREDLTEEQRKQLGMNMREVWRSAIKERMDEYQNAPEEDRQAVLDRHIDEFQKFREEGERRAKEREKESDKEKEAREQRWRGAMGSQSKEERKERSESRNPDQMARMMVYFGEMRARMTERGIKPPDGPGHRGMFGP